MSVCLVVWSEMRSCFMVLDPKLPQDFVSTQQLTDSWDRHRTMNKVPGMKTLIITVGRSVAALSQVFILLIFLRLFGGILAMDLFAGALRRRCFVDPTQNFTAAAKSRLESQRVISSFLALTCLHIEMLCRVQP